jgi:hypothetical protein
LNLTDDKVDVEKVKKFLLNSIEKQNPENLDKLIQKTRDWTKLSEDEIIDLLVELEAEKEIKLVKSSFIQKGWRFSLSSETFWYWVIIFLCSITIGFVFFVPDDIGSLLYVQYLVGIPFVLYLPGYALMNTVFPNGVLKTTGQTSLGLIERVVMNFSFSLALTAILSFILTYTPWGLTSSTLVLSMSAFTITLSTYNVVRTYREKRLLQLRKARKNNAYFTA